MDIYEWKSDVDARWLTTRREEDLDRLSFDGAPAAPGWVPVPVEWIRDAPGDDRREITDCPNLVPGAPVLSARAAAALEPLLAGAGELLPLSHETHGYFVLNVTRVLDALDEERSDLVRFGAGARIMLARTHVFRERVVGTFELFKDRRFAGSAVFVTGPFVRQTEHAGLTGFRFRHVWTSDC